MASGSKRLRPDDEFQITFQGETRAVTRSQLDKAPDSQLYKWLISDQDEPARALELGSSEGCGQWRDGNPDLFKVAKRLMVASSPSVLLPFDLENADKLTWVTGCDRLLYRHVRAAKLRAVDHGYKTSPG